MTHLGRSVLGTGGFLVELEDRNQSAAASLAEGLEETLTLHRLGVYGVLGASFKTTNCLESVNALIEERYANVDAWKNSNQRHRWLATALLNLHCDASRAIGTCRNCAAHCNEN